MPIHPAGVWGQGKTSLWILGRILGIALLDQVTKSLVVNCWPVGHQTTVIPELLYIVHFRNTGAAWGMFADYSTVLIAFSLIALAVLGWEFHKLADGAPCFRLALTLMMGGIVGNLIDRVGRGSVVDFVFFSHGALQWPAFNVADSCITVGVCIYVFASIFRRGSMGLHLCEFTM